MEQDFFDVFDPVGFVKLDGKFETALNLIVSISKRVKHMDLSQLCDSHPEIVVVFCDLTDRIVDALKQNGVAAFQEIDSISLIRAAVTVNCYMRRMKTPLVIP